MRINSIEYDLKPSEKLYFLHIQKTAGTTFYFSLDEKFDPEEICPARFWRQFLKLAKGDLKQLRSYRLFRGHFGDAIPQFLRKPPVCLTVLRDPIKRSISHYEHIRREPKDRRHKLVTSENMDLMAFAQHPETRLAILNLQTRSIGFDLGMKQIRKIRGFAAKGVLGTVIDDRSDEEMLAIAKSRVDEFPFVGMVERFQDSLFLLSYIFGWYPIRQSRALNTAPKKTQKSDLSPEVLDLLYDCNRLDLELYDYAKAKFDEQFTLMVKALWSAYGDRPSEPVPEQVDDDTLFSWLVQHYEDRNSRRNLQRHQVIDFPFSKAISGSGWHLREGSGSGWHLPGGLTEGGTPFRWTGPEVVSTLDFPVATTADLTLKLRIINAAALDILESLSLSVNGHPVELEAILRQGSLAVLEALIPQKVLKSDRNFTRFTFTVNRTTIINPDSSDNRPVGLAFHRLQLFPEHVHLDDDEDFTHYVFPTDDKNWMQVANVLESYLNDDDKIAAPGEFFKPFPKHFRSQNLPFADKPQLHWVILHKGKLQVVDRPSIYWAIKQMQPVFQNDVFIVLCNRDDIPKQAWRLQDLLILRSQLLLFQLESRKLLPVQWRDTLFRSSRLIYQQLKTLISKS
ncbi:MAG: hypothetical protein WBA57_17660 [Elainellaceae cyanobacterium]